MRYSDKCIGCKKCESVCKYQLKSCDLCGKCQIICPNDAIKISGAEYSVTELLDIILKDLEYYNLSGGGVTFSGGECMLQIDFLEKILRRCKELNIHTAIDTAGNVTYEHFEKILPYTDLFLYDIKCIDDDLHKELTGVSNKLILENLKNLSGKASIIVRVPIIGGFNDNTSRASEIADFLKEIDCQVEVLPYHNMGESKYAALGLEFKEFYTPSEEKINQLKSILNK